jgi:hypothetical protein
LAYALLNLGEWAAQRKERSGRGRDSGGPSRNALGPRPAALGGSLLALMAAGCFTGPINRPPSVSIDPLETPALRRQAVMFHAQASDPDGDTPSLKWAFASGSGDCMVDPPAAWTMSGGDGRSYMVPGEKTDVPFCVWVMATDSHGATFTASKGTDPQDQPPTAAIQIVSPDPVPITTSGVYYSLYSTFQLSPKLSDPEGDSLMPPQLVLDHTRAPGSIAVLMPCGPANGADQCFFADVQGEYDVSLTVADSFGKQGTAMPQKIIVLADQPPCIGSSDPDFLMSPMVEVTLSPPTNPKPDPLPSFTIHSVADDGAPWPPGPKGGPTFRWYVSTDDGQHFQFVDNDYPTLLLASTGDYKTGDIVKVRVEVSDRNPKNDMVLDGCDDKNDLCQAVPGCFQRVTWSVDFR